MESVVALDGLVVEAPIGVASQLQFARRRAFGSIRLNRSERPIQFPISGGDLPFWRRAQRCHLVRTNISATHVLAELASVMPACGGRQGVHWISATTRTGEENTMAGNDTGPGVAVITGGASGIGLTTAELLLTRGWKVALLDLPGATLEQAKATYASNKHVITEAVDVTDEPAVEAVLAAIEKHHGPITGVVNSAGIARDINALETPVELFRKILDVNVVGSFIVARGAARLMKQRKRGAIVNISSISGLRGSKGRVAYGTSKGAVITMTQVLANELAKHGIRVNAVAPGPAETPMVKALHSQTDRKLWRTYVPMRRYAEPIEVATAIAFLIDDSQAGYITGEVLAVDGGFRGAGIILPDEDQ